MMENDLTFTKHRLPPDLRGLLLDGNRHIDTRSSIIVYLHDYLCSIVSQAGIPVQPMDFTMSVHLDNSVGYSINCYGRRPYDATSNLIGTIYFNKHGRFISFNTHSSPEEELF
ncbi:hypothetical protein [Tortoise microvirus 96]|nr:hypothetical protein [Tortoise microvirus 96]QPB07384.1 MAG: hypothetical protein [Microvirus sp.]